MIPFFRRLTGDGRVDAYAQMIPETLTKNDGE
jgi:hypothetical protein